MLVILASQCDQGAASLLTKWSAHQAVLMRASDLSLAGWRHHVGFDEEGKAVVGGRLCPIHEIDGVLTRLPWVDESELGHIHPEDRSYVAAEMSAFLVAWLSWLPCRVLNRPTPQCLAGPNWTMEGWVSLAAELGIPHDPIQRRTAATSEQGAELHCEQRVTVKVLGKQCFGSQDPLLRGMASELAQASGAELLAVHFATGNGIKFVGADPWPDVTDVELSDAIAKYLLEEAL